MVQGKLSNTIKYIRRNLTIIELELSDSKPDIALCQLKADVVRIEGDKLIKLIGERDD